MRNKTLMTVVASAVLAGSAFGEDEIDYSFYAGYDTNYIFRGADLGNDLFSYGIDASGSCDCGFDWYAGVWFGSYRSGDLDGFNGNDENETDIYGGVSKDLGFVTASVGFIHFSFDSNNTGGLGVSEDTTEIVFGLSKSIGVIDLDFTWYEDVDAFDSTYVEFNASHSRELTDRATLNLGLGFGNYDDFGGTDSYLFYSVTTGVDYALSDKLTLSTYITAEFTEGARNVTNVEDNEFFGGASLSFSL